MRTIAIPPRTRHAEGSGSFRCPPVQPVATVSQPLPVIWIPPVEPFNPLEGATDDLIDGLVDHIEAEPSLRP